jgi:hypothetical protein
MLLSKKGVVVPCLSFTDYAAAPYQAPARAADSLRRPLLEPCMESP